AARKLVFYTASYNGNLKNPVTGMTTVNASTPYTISAKIGTGLNAAWEIRVNGVVEMSSATSGTADLGATNNGSILLGGGSAYTDIYNESYVDIAPVTSPIAVSLDLKHFAQTPSIAS